MSANGAADPSPSCFPPSTDLTTHKGQHNDEGSCPPPESSPGQERIPENSFGRVGIACLDIGDDDKRMAEDAA
jgi:hypothetical protein